MTTNGEKFCRYGTVLYQIELDNVSKAFGRPAEAQELRPQDGKRVFQCLETCVPQCPNLVDVEKMREARQYDDLKFGWRQYIADVREVRERARQRATLFDSLTSGF